MIRLASGSETRARLLAAAGVTFEVASPPSTVEETLKAKLLREGAPAREIARELALAKAGAVREALGGIVVGADQTLELDGELRSKAGSIEVARERLTELRGRVHQLHSAVAVVDRTGWSCVETATMTMRRFSDAFLDGYLARNADAARFSLGGYHFESEGAQLFETVGGDFFTILGLPLLPLLDRLRELGELAA